MSIFAETVVLCQVLFRNFSPCCLLDRDSWKKTIRSRRLGGLDKKSESAMNNYSQQKWVPTIRGDQVKQENQQKPSETVPDGTPRAFPEWSPEVDACYWHYRRVDVPRLVYRGLNDAEGVFDEAFSSVYGERDILDPEFEECLRRRERDIGFKEYKKAARYRELFSPLPDGYEEMVGLESEQVAHVERMEKAELLSRSMRQLSHDDQMFLRLRYWEEASCEYIASSVSARESEPASAHQM